MGIGLGFDHVGRIAEVLNRQAEFLRRNELLEKMVIARKKSECQWGKEEENEHTVQKRSPGALRVVPAYQGR